MTDLLAYYPRLAVSVAPVAEPVTAAEFKVFAQYEDTDQDALIASLITAARSKVEHDCDLALMPQTRVMRLDKFPTNSDTIQIHLHPVTAVVVTYDDENGDNQTLASSNYTIDLTNLPPRLKLISTAVWPTTEFGTTNAVTLTITAGYTNADAVPATAKLAINLLAREWFYGRCATGEVGDGATMAYGALCNQLRWRPAII